MDRPLSSASDECKCKRRRGWDIYEPGGLARGEGLVGARAAVGSGPLKLSRLNDTIYDSGGAGRASEQKFDKIAVVKEVQV